jgi:hypothetical protein
MNAHNENRLSDASQEGVPSVSQNFAAVRRCESCLLEYPLQHFRRRHSGQELRMRECRLCHNLRERLRRAGIRHRLSRREMAKAMTHLKNCTAATRVPVFCAEMVQHFGGTTAFVDTWKSCIDRDLEKGGLPAFRHVAVLLKFMDYCQPEPVDYSTMSDEELEASIRALRGELAAYS